MSVTNPIFGCKTLRAPVALAVAALLASGGAARAQPPGSAVMNITVSQIGSDVVVNFLGNINVGSLTFSQTAFGGYSEISPGAIEMTIGGPGYPTQTIADFYSLSVPSLSGAFSVGSAAFASSASGNFFGFIGIVSAIEVPTGYITGTLLSGSSTFANKTLSDLALNPGSYSQTYATSSTINLTIVNSVPEPASLGLVVGGVAVLGAVRRRKRA